MRMKHVIAVIVFVSLVSVSGNIRGKEVNTMEKSKHKYTNHLINESSPYLLMHAHNPVDWYPWGKEALEKARKEKKLIIISIGYAACHWCHVMEEQSFEDPEVARLMNENFVSIKVDREERPDIDQVYMSAAQLITGSGGWPLNAVALPDGRPFFAGTYFPKQNWISLLTRIRDVHAASPEKLLQQAESVTQGIRSAELVNFNPVKPDFSMKELQDAFSKWTARIDYEWGGHKGAPKFPMPVDHRFLLYYFHLTGETKALEAVTVTLDRMAMGGIYDQVGGGFARYSTDNVWKVPHFEKMLYDNAQLVSLYSYAYQLTKKPLYKRVVYDTLEFVERELTSKEGGFYSSLDADSEGEEGKFYVWSETALKKILGKDAPVVMAYYNVTGGGNWEEGKNILFSRASDDVFAKKHGLSPDQLRQKIDAAGKKLLAARSKRVRPPLDDKILTAWNALMLTGYVDAYRVFHDERFLERALKSAGFLKKNALSSDGRLNRNYKDGKSSINGFLDDYAFLIRAFIGLYQVTFDEKWLFEADKMTTYALTHFYDESSRMFYYTSGLDPALIARKMEITDNVIPGSNSEMGMNLYLLGEYFYKEEYIEKSRRMLNNVKGNLLKYGGYFSNWGILMAHFVSSPYEVAIVGENWAAVRRELDGHYLPGMILMGGKEEGKLPLLKDKLVQGRTTIYVCKDKACRLPVTDIKKALEQMNREK
ncbi:MAG: thioredoxin domain-containing protein [bacterium]|nr:thioredoxin domain-containing protein [bacterium]